MTGFDIPTLDQRGETRLNPPCIGAFDAPTEAAKITKTWTITTNTSDATDTGSFGYAFGKAGDGDIIEFNMPSDTIALSAALSRGTSSSYTNYQNTTITVNGINQATGNPIVLDCENLAASIYRSHSGDWSAINFTFNNVVFYKSVNSSQNGGAFSLGHSSFTQVTHYIFNGCTFEECSSGALGGAIDAGKYIDLTVENCTFINNSASQGGAVNAGNANGFSAKFINSTFYGNNATVMGGALYSTPAATDPTQVINCTFVGNTAPQGGGVAEAGTLATTLVNCIVTRNSIAADVVPDVFGVNLALQNCIVERKDASVVTDVNPVAFDGLIFAGGVAELKDNGGPTQTIAISNDGAAFKAGIATLDGFAIPTLDQRGETRLTPPCIGAFDAPTESGIITGLTSVSSQSFVAFATGKQIQIVSANAGWATVYNLTGIVIDKAYVDGNTILPAILTSGIYIVRLAENNGNVSTAKVLVK